MPDLATHVLTPLICLHFLEIIRKKRLLLSYTRYIFALGCILPDLIDKSIPYSISFLYTYGVYLGLLEKNDFYFPSFEFLHSPFCLIILIYIISQLFHEEYRKNIFILIAIGTLIHLILDMIQGNSCGIGYLWYFPFSLDKSDILTLFYDEQTVPLVPIFLITFIMVKIIHNKLIHNK